MTQAEPAMQSLCIRLEACAPERRCFRGCEIAAGQDLFGLWVMALSYEQDILARADLPPVP
jgi:hypothetical protein